MGYWDRTRFWAKLIADTTSEGAIQISVFIGGLLTVAIGVLGYESGRNNDDDLAQVAGELTVVVGGGATLGGLIGIGRMLPKVANKIYEEYKEDSDDEESQLPDIDNAVNASRDVADDTALNGLGTEGKNLHAALQGSGV